MRRIGALVLAVGLGFLAAACSTEPAQPPVQTVTVAAPPAAVAPSTTDAPVSYLQMSVFSPEGGLVTVTLGDRYRPATKQNVTSTWSYPAAQGAQGVTFRAEPFVQGSYPVQCSVTLNGAVIGGAESGPNGEPADCSSYIR